MEEALKSFVAGWAGGLGMLAVGHPFDTIKTRLQADTQHVYKGAMDCLVQSVRKEGPLAVYKGVTAPLAGVGVVFAVYFVAFDTTAAFLRRMRGKAPGSNLSMPEIMACAASTGVAGTCVLGPAELLKVRQQTAILKGLDGSMGAVVRGIYREHGMRGFLTGFGATLARDVPGSMCWFGAYEVAKQTLCEDPSKPAVHHALIAGGCGGIANWLAVLPLDTIKTRVQANHGGVRLSFAGAAKQILRDRGVAGLYKGFAPILLRAFPANAACFATKEITQAQLNRIC